MSITTELPPQEQIPATITEGQLYGLADMLPEHLDEAIGFANAVPIGGELRPVTEQDDPKIVAGAILARIGIREYADTNETPATVMVEMPDGSIVPKQFVITREDFGTTLRPEKAEPKSRTEEDVVIPVVDQSETSAVQVSVLAEKNVPSEKKFELSHQEHDWLLSDLDGLKQIDRLDPSAPHNEAKAVEDDARVQVNMEAILLNSNPISDGFRLLSMARDLGATRSGRVSGIAREQLRHLITTTKSVAPELALELMKSVVMLTEPSNGTVSSQRTTRALLNKIIDSYDGVEGGKMAQAVVSMIGYGVSLKTHDGLLRSNTQDRLASLIKHV